MEPAGLTLPGGALPRAAVAPDVMALARARGLAFDRMGRAYAVRDDHAGFCLFAGCEAAPPACFALADAGTLGGIAIDARDRLFVALPDRAEVRVLRLSPPGEIGHIPMRRPVAVGVDARGRAFVLDVGDPTPPPSGDPIDVEVIRVWRADGDVIAVSAEGAVAVVTRQSSTIGFAPDGTNFSVLDLGRPALPAAAFARDAGQPPALLVGDALSGRIVNWQIQDGQAAPLAWSAGVDAWTASHTGDRSSRRSGAAARSCPSCGTRRASTRD